MFVVMKYVEYGRIKYYMNIDKNKMFDGNEL